MTSIRMKITLCSHESIDNTISNLTIFRIFISGCSPLFFFFFFFGYHDVDSIVALYCQRSIPDVMLSM
jgi:hypothetical protein